VNGRDGYGAYAYYMPVKIVSGRDCVAVNASLLRPFGKKALIVTGKSSAKNGALKDVTDALTENGQTFDVFDRVTPNPDLACVQAGALAARAYKAEFIVGIGGGSPLDAAKAVALLALQPRKDGEIFSGGWKDTALPVIAVPTTAGTGSEVTPYAVLTNPFKKTKTSISSPAVFPKIAFLDGKYIWKTDRRIMKNTAADALSHAVEGMFTVKSNPIGDMAALESIGTLFSIFPVLGEEILSLETCDRLLYASMLAGTVIAQSGTTAVHAMGYPLTYHYGTPHGEANGVLLGAMMRLCMERLPETTEKILRAAGLNDVEEFEKTLKNMLKGHTVYAANDLIDYAEEVAANPKLSGVTYRPDKKDVLKMYLESDIVKG